MRRLGTASVLGFLLLAACGIEVPEERQSYVGLWTGPGTSLEITRDGRVEYERKKGSATTTLSAPLKAFEGDDFVAGVWFLAMSFDVQQPPHRVASGWSMTVDGVELTRVR